MSIQFKTMAVSLRKAIPAQKPPLKNFIYASFVIGFLGIILVALSQRNLPPEVPLFYGLPEGEEQLTSSWGLVIPLASSLVIITLNACISFFLQNSFLQKTLVLGSFVIAFLSFITTIKIILLVGSF